MRSDARSACRLREGGFSIVELAIVMIIIGVIVSGGLGFYTPYMQQAAKEKNGVIVGNAVKALVAFAGGYKYLPTTLVGQVRDYQDAMGTNLQYRYDTNLTSASSVCNRNSAAYTVNFAGDATKTITNVALIVWSYGYDKTNSVTEVDATKTITVPDYSSTTDDMVSWATLSELKAAVGCGSSLQILADAMPAGSVGVTYGSTVTFKPDGGIASYQWCVEFPASVRSKFTFSQSLSPQTSFGACSSATYTTSIASDGSLTMTGASALASSDQGGPYDFIVFLKDGNTSQQSTSRRFSFYVN
ncbi:MAG: hypothetical protein HQM03_06990 [Magnetococcales bacterium]|nr:hypothetical protein [Magnetococcales bacterium]